MGAHLRFLADAENEVMMSHNIPTASSHVLAFQVSEKRGKLKTENTKTLTNQKLLLYYQKRWLLFSSLTADQNSLSHDVLTSFIVTGHNLLKLPAQSYFR